MRTVDEIARKLDALGLWSTIAPHHWAVKPCGSAFPYFCCVRKGERPQVKVRLLLLEGWGVFHEYVRLQQDRFFGFCQSPIELSHFELVFLEDGSVRAFRHDPCYLPRATLERENELLVKLLWEVYGVMLRLENDPKLPLVYSADQAMFSRVQAKDSGWRDEPLAIPPPRPHTETVVLDKAMLAKAKDRAFVKEAVIDLDFRLLNGVMTREERPRTVYALVMVDEKSGERICFDRISPSPEAGIRALWEGLAPQVLSRLVERGVVPGEIKTVSPRVFRLLRPLTIELPFRLSINDSLPLLEKNMV